MCELSMGMDLESAALKDHETGARISIQMG
jgi:hypothetical protein